MDSNTIDNVMDNFDFEAVHKTMTVLNWEWFDAEAGVPTIAEIRVAARKLLRHAVKFASEQQRRAEVMTGGFHVLVDPDDQYISLTFIVAQMDNYSAIELGDDTFSEVVLDKMH